MSLDPLNPPLDPIGPTIAPVDGFASELAARRTIVFQPNGMSWFWRAYEGDLLVCRSSRAFATAALCIQAARDYGPSWAIYQADPATGDLVQVFPPSPAE